MSECIQCRDNWPRDKMLSLDSWIDTPDDPDLVCLRCALVAIKGGPNALTEEEREELRVKI